MKNKAGLQLQLSEKEIKKNWRKIFVSSGKAMIMFASGKPESGLKELASYGDAITTADKPETIALYFVVDALEKATYNLLKENRDLYRSDLDNPEELEGFQLYAKFLDGITKLTKDKEIFIDKTFLNHPKSLSILPDFIDHLKGWLRLFDITDIDAEQIGNRFSTYFVFELHDLYRKNLSKYTDLINRLDNTLSPAVQREVEWEAYYSYLERQIEAPIFAESFGLKEVYIPLRAYYEKKQNETSRRDRRTEQQRGEKIVIPLQETLDKWLDTPGAHDEIKVLSGGPGSGKSSFAKMWTANVAKQRKRPIIFIPLHLFNINSDVATALGEYLKGSPDIPLNYNPLEAPRPEDRLLIVFDGLDELVMQGKTAQQSAIDFIEELRILCNKINAEKKRLKILIAGRPIAVQNAENRLRGTQEQVLHLLPYYLIENEINNYGTGKTALETDQRPIWWDKFYQLKGIPSQKGLPKELQNENIDKLTAEPLLNYLVALAWKKDAARFNQDTNLNEIYEILMQGVYERQYGQDQHIGAKGLNEGEFFQILEEIAVCAWQSNKDVRVTTTQKIETHIEGNSSTKALLEKYKTAAQGGITRLLTAFYFRKYGTEVGTGEETFEFTHKSFGEYLTARALVELLDELDYEMRKVTDTRSRRNVDKFDEEKALELWVKITGPTTANGNLKEFIFNEIRYRKEHKAQPVEQWQDSLCRLIEKAVRTGMPFKEPRYTQLEEQHRARNAGETLMLMLAACANITKKVSKIDWGDELGFSQWLKRLFTSLSQRDMINYLLHYIYAERADLRSANLSYCLLYTSPSPRDRTRSRMPSSA